MTPSPKLPTTAYRILSFLATYRYLQRPQLQSLLNHQSPNRLNYYLKRLTDDAYINRHYAEATRERTKPAVYSLAKKGARIVKQQDHVSLNMQTVYRNTAVTKEFRQTHILLAEVIMHVREYANNNGFTHTVYPKQALRSYDFLPDIVADAYVILGNDNSKQRYFIHCLPWYTNIRFIKGYINQYLDYFWSNTWQEATGYDFPTIVLLSQDEENHTRWQQFITKRLLEEQAPFSILLTTPTTAFYAV